MCTITKNENFNSFELTFDGKPSEKIRDILKANGYRWHGKRGIWYGYKDISALLNDEQPAATITTANTEQPKSKKLAPLWERTRTDDLPKYGTDNELKKAARDSGKCYDKAAAAIIRKHLRERFPEVKFSVTSGGAGYLMNVDITIKSSPYALHEVKGDPNAHDYHYRYDHKEKSDELAAVLEYCNALHRAFDADDGDRYADYGAYHDLYGGASLYYEYEQTEPTAEQRADMEVFKIAKAQDEEQERIESERRWQEEERRREQQQREYEERMAQEYADELLILEHIEVEDLPEDGRIVALGLACGAGKEATLDEVRETINATDENGKPQLVHFTDAEIWRKVKFTNEELFTKFCKMFSRDWNFCMNMGGTTSEDVRLEQIDIDKLTAEQRATVHFFDCKCIGVYLNGVLQFVIDPQGHNYARYVYLPAILFKRDEETDEYPAAKYRAEHKAKSEHLTPFYIPAPLSEQIESANLQAGEEITILKIDSWICSAQSISGKLISATPQPYAQYNVAARITLITQGKRKESIIITHAGENFVLYRGILPAIPESLKYTTVHEGAGAITQRVNFAGAGADDFLKKAIAYYKELGYSPIINLIPN